MNQKKVIICLLCQYHCFRFSTEQISFLTVMLVFFLYVFRVERIIGSLTSRVVFDSKLDVLCYLRRSLFSIQLLIWKNCEKMEKFSIIGFWQN